MEINKSVVGSDFTVYLGYEWCHPDEPLVAWVEMDEGNSENVSGVEYSPDVYFPDNCHQAFFPEATGQKTDTSATLVTDGFSWDDTPVCSDSVETSL